MLNLYIQGQAQRKPTTKGNSMATMAELVTKPVKAGCSFKASSWRAVDIDGDTRHIYHYSTLMAELVKGELTQVSEGWGSMSDKCGMSKLRSALQKMPRKK
jgi:hypothetical protein